MKAGLNEHRDSVDVIRNYMLKLASSFIVAVLVTIAACSTTGFGPGAQGAHPPPLPAGAQLVLWEHYCVNPRSVSDFNTVLAEAGAAGWEMVGVGVTQSNLLACFKRPAARSSAPTSPQPLPSAGSGAAPGASTPDRGRRRAGDLGSNKPG